MAGARLFVAAVFVLLALTFPVAAVVLRHEFGPAWISLATFHSSTFLFYPIFGTLALLAFFVPAVIFTHMYWFHVPYGRLRFSVGTLVVVALSIFVADRWAERENWAAWHFAPSVAADAWEPASCPDQGRGACQRGPLMKHTLEVANISRTRWGLSKFVRNCTPDPLLEIPREELEQRFCVVAGAKLDAAQCCRAQAAFIRATASLRDAPRSITYQAHRLLRPFQVFFLLVLIVIGFMLTFWRKNLEIHYSPELGRVERGLVLGAGAMLFWPFMDYAYLQSSGAIYGAWSGRFTPSFSLMVGPWALLLLFFFLTRFSERRRNLGRAAGTAVGALAVFKFEEATDAAVKLTGSGMGGVGLVGLVVFAIATLFGMILLRRLLVGSGRPAGNSGPSAA